MAGHPSFERSPSRQPDLHGSRMPRRRQLDALVPHRRPVPAARHEVAGRAPWDSLDAESTQRVRDRRLLDDCADPLLAANG
jgi:hypothetical protein